MTNVLHTKVASGQELRKKGKIEEEKEVELTQK